MRNRNRLLLLLVSLMLFLSAFQAVAADTRLDAVRESGILRVGMTGDYKPFTYLTPEGNFEGIDVDMANSLGESLGIKVEFVKTSWKQITQDLVDGKYDIAMGGISTRLSRQMQAFFTLAYLTTGKTPITRRENVDRFQTLEQIDQPEVKVIVNPGGTNEKFARANLKKAQIVVYDDNVTIFDQIVEGKADLMITDAVETLLQEKAHPELAAVHPDSPFNLFEKAYMVPRGDIVFLEYVNLWLHDMMLTGEFQEIFDHWIEKAAD